MAKIQKSKKTSPEPKQKTVKKINQKVKEPIQKIKAPKRKPVSKAIKGMINNKYEMPNR